MSYTKFTTLPTLCIVEKLEGGRISEEGRIQDSSWEGHHPSRRGRQHTNLPDFPQKMHEIKKILVRRGVQGTPPYLDLPLVSREKLILVFFFTFLCDLCVERQQYIFPQFGCL